jgi:thioredoxin-like negative regulator of GroEL
MPVDLDPAWILGAGGLALGVVLVTALRQRTRSILRAEPGWIRQARDAARQGRLPDAEDCLWHALAETPEDAQLWILHAHAAREMGNDALAVASLVVAARLSDSGEAEHWTMEILTTLGEHDAAAVARETSRRKMLQSIRTALSPPPDPHDEDD